MIGIGQSFTPRSFVASCSQFVTLASLESSDKQTEARPNSIASTASTVPAASTAYSTRTASDASKKSAASTALPASVASKPPSEADVGTATQEQHEAMRLVLDKRIKSQSNSKGWTQLSKLGDALKANDAGFDPKHFGARRSSLKELMEMMPEYEVSEVGPDVLIRRRSMHRWPSSSVRVRANAVKR